MLAQFLTANRAVIIERAQRRLASRIDPKPTEAELKDGIPVFLNQIVDVLKLSETSGATGQKAITRSAAEHSQELFRIGLTIGQVVHDYGDVCQAITELAVTRQEQIGAKDFQTLNRCLDDAIAGAVTEYARNSKIAIANHETERLGKLAQELRTLLNTATIAFETIRSGRVPANGSTGLLHSRNLVSLREIIDRLLADVRLEAGLVRIEPISVEVLIAEIETTAAIQAQAFGIPFRVRTSQDRTLTVEGDRQILIAALGNLLLNALRFARGPDGVTLSTSATADRVLFEIEDECSGMSAEGMDDRIQRVEEDDAKRGDGTGLSMVREVAKVSGGQIRIASVAGRGCVFTLDMPRRHPAPSSTPSKRVSAPA